MKVIFIKKVPKVGNINDIKEQPDGYVRNFLIPKGFAILATPEAVKKLERAQSEVRVVKEIQTDLFQKNIRSVAGVAVTIKAMVNAQGNLFKAIHAKDIAVVLKKNHQITIAEEYIKLHEPIKHVGTFTVGVEAMGIKESISVEVVKA
jgi:large subunit ribosomal protein L9